jgi:hypothetical protein
VVREDRRAVRRRLREARRRLWASAAEGGELPELKATREEISVLSDLAHQVASRKRRAILWIAFFALVAIGGILQLVHLPRVELALQGTAGQLVVTSGSSSVPALEGERIQSIRIDLSERSQGWCDGGSPEGRSGCQPVAELLLNGLVLHPRGRTGLSLVDGCLGLEIHQGSLTLDFSFATAETRFGVGHEVYALRAGDAAEICGSFVGPFTVPQPQRLVLGYERSEPVVNPVALPALKEGSVVFSATGQERRLFPTETLTIDGLENAFLAVRLEQPLAVSLSGVAQSLSTSTGGVRSRNLKPTLLNWVTGSEWVAGLLALLGGAAGLLLTISDSLRKLGS